MASRLSGNATKVEVFDVGRLRSGIFTWIDGIRDEAFEAVRDAGPEAEDDMVIAVYEAVTKTGAERASRGGDPGRIETHRMVNAITHRVTEETKSSITLEWGWLDTFEDYFGYQEGGIGASGNHPGFEGMNALGGSFVRTQDRLWGKIARMRGKR